MAGDLRWFCLGLVEPLLLTCLSCIASTLLVPRNNCILTSFLFLFKNVFFTPYQIKHFFGLCVSKSSAETTYGMRLNFFFQKQQVSFLYELKFSKLYLN